MHHRGSGFGRFLLVIVLSLAMVLNGFPVQALAEIVEDTPVVQDGDAPDAGDEEVMSEADTGEGTVSEPSDSISTSSEELVDETLVLEEVAVTEIATQEFDASGEELAAAYIEAQFDEQLPAGDDALSTDSAADQLTGNDLIAYNALKPMVSAVAAGERQSTEFELPTTLFADKTSWTAEELGVSSLVVDGAINPEASAALRAVFAFDSDAVIRALINDLPYDMYWYDKTTGSTIGSIKISVSGSNGTYIMSPTSNPYVSMDVASEFADSSGKYLVDTTLGQSVSSAVETARAIVDEHAGEDAYTMLSSFKDEICSRVAYNHDAADDNSTPYGNPWQLLWVFDGVDSTTVVCEGYSKAFKYLCDLSALEDVECLTVSGFMTGGTGAGRHMWNVVKMDDGKNYLVDVTNCDAGSIGYPDELFMAIPTSGSVADEYVMQAGNTDITYEYDDNMTSIYTVDALTLSDTAYQMTGTQGIPVTPENYEEVFQSKHNYADDADITWVYTDDTAADGFLVTFDERTETEYGYDYITIIDASDNDVATYTGTELAGQTIEVESPRMFKVRLTSDGSNTCWGFAVTDVRRIDRTDLSNATVSIPSSVYPYTGSAVEPAVTVTLYGTQLVAGTDYVVSYSDNIEPGNATITITAVENSGYTGSKDVSFAISDSAMSMDGFRLVLLDPTETHTFNWEYHYPTVQLIDDQDSVLLTVSDDYQDEDIVIAYTDNYDAGTATVTATPVVGGSYAGDSLSCTFDIEPLDIADATFDEEQGEYGGIPALPSNLTEEEYNAQEWPQLYYVDTTWNEQHDVTYELSVPPFTGIGDYQLVYTGTDDFTGTRTVDFTVGRDLASDDVSMDVETVYSQSSFDPYNISMTVLYQGSYLYEDEDYTYEVSDLDEDGYGTITLTGMERYHGTRVIPFMVMADDEPIDISSGELVLSQQLFFADQSGDEITQDELSINVPVYHGDELVGTITLPSVESDERFSISYENNVTGPTATVTVSATDDEDNIYFGSVSADFTIVDIANLDLTDVSTLNLIDYVSFSEDGNPCYLVSADGSAVEPTGTLELTVADANKSIPFSEFANYGLTASYANNEAAGLASVTVSNNVSSKTTPFEIIESISLSEAFNYLGFTWDLTTIVLSDPLPAPRILDTDTIKAERDFTYSYYYFDPNEDGEVECEVTMTAVEGSRFYGSVTESVMIREMLNTDDLTFELVDPTETITYDSYSKYPTVQIIDSEGTVILEASGDGYGPDFEISYQDNLHAGTARVVATPTDYGQYTGDPLTCTFVINPCDISDATYAQEQGEYGRMLDLPSNCTEEEYNEHAWPMLYLRSYDWDDWYERLYPTYDLTVPAFYGRGAYQLTYTGTGDFTGTKTIDFNVGRDINDATLDSDFRTVLYEFEYDDLDVSDLNLGLNYFGNVLYRDGSYPVEYEGFPADFTVSVDPVNDGVGAITVTGVNAYHGTRIIKIAVLSEDEQIDISDASVDLSDTLYYASAHGVAREPEILGLSVPVSRNGEVIGTQWVDNVHGGDFTVSYENNVTGPDATVTVTAIASNEDSGYRNAYSGTVSTTFHIVDLNALDLEECGSLRLLNGFPDPDTYESCYLLSQDGSCEPEFVLDVTYGEEYFSLNKDELEDAGVSYSYANNEAVGTATLTVSNVVSSVSTEFTVVDTFDLSSLNSYYDLEFTPDYYTDPDTLPKPRLVLPVDLAEGVDFDYTWTYGEIDEYGDLLCTVTMTAREGQERCTGTYTQGVWLSHRIETSSLRFEFQDPSATYTYKGYDICPPVVLYDADGNEICSTEYYSTFDGFEIRYDDNVHAGTGSVTASFYSDGNYYGDNLTLTFEIAPFDIANAYCEPFADLPATITSFDGIEWPPLKMDAYSEDLDIQPTIPTFNGIGSYELVYKGTGDFTGTKTVSFNVGRNLGDENSCHYWMQHTALLPYEYEEALMDGFYLEVSYDDVDGYLVEGQDYTQSVSTIDEQGRGTLTLTAVEGSAYYGTREIPFTVLADDELIDISAAQLYLSENNFLKDAYGEPFEPNVYRLVIPVYRDGEVIGTRTEYSPDQSNSFVVTYADNVDAGTASVTVTAVNYGEFTTRYTGSATGSFVITDPLDINLEDATDVELLDYLYSSYEYDLDQDVAYYFSSDDGVRPEFTVYLYHNGNTYELDSTLLDAYGFTVSYSDVDAEGNATVTVSNRVSSIACPYRVIDTVEIWKVLDYRHAWERQGYTISDPMPEPKIVNTDYLQEGRDFVYESYEYGEPDSEGNVWCYVTVCAAEGQTRYTGSCTLDVLIEDKLNTDELTIEFVDPSARYVYNNENQFAPIRVLDADGTVVFSYSGNDWSYSDDAFEITYNEPGDPYEPSGYHAGTVEVNVRPQYASDYAGDPLTLTYTIEPRDISDAEVFGLSDFPSNFTQEMYDAYRWPDPCIPEDENSSYSIDSYDLEVPPYAGHGDYELVYTGIGDYCGTVTVPFTIGRDIGDDDKCDFYAETLYLTSAEFAAFDDSDVECVLRYEYTTLELKTDYQIKELVGPDDNHQAYVVLEGINKYHGERRISVMVDVTPLDSGAIAFAPIPNQAYTGEAITPELSLSVDGAPLVKGTDYTVSFEDNIEIGRATVTVTGIGAYCGTISRSFYIKAALEGHEDARFWGVAGGCIWWIDDAGQLTVAPADGVSGTLAYEGVEYGNVEGNVPPWFFTAYSVRSAVVEEGVTLPTLAYFFVNCSNMISFDLSSADTSQVTNMEYMFYGCRSLTTIDLESFVTSSPTSIEAMFLECGVTSLDLSEFDLSDVIHRNYVFSGCRNLEQVTFNDQFTYAFNEEYGSEGETHSLVSTLCLPGYTWVNEETGVSFDFPDMEEDTQTILEGTWVRDRSSENTGWDCEYELVDGVLTIRPKEGKTVGHLPDNFYSWMDEDGVYKNAWDTLGINRSEVTEIRFEGNVIAGSSLNSMFSNMNDNDDNSFANLEVIDFRNLDTSRVRNWEGLLYGCDAVTTVDFSTAVIRKNANINYLFMGKSNLSSIKLSDSFGPYAWKEMVNAYNEETGEYEEVEQTVTLGFPFYRNVGGVTVACHWRDEYGRVFNEQTIQQLSSMAGTWTSVSAGEVTKIDVNSLTFSVDDDGLVYNGRAQTPNAVTVSFLGDQLTEGTDYGISYSNNVNAGEATVVITGMGDYAGTREETFTIQPAPISEAQCADIDSVVYTGLAFTPDVSLTYQGMALVKDTDYTLSYTNNVTAGTAVVTITGTGNYTGTREASFTIEKADPAMATEPSARTSLVYTGSAQALVSEGSATGGTLQYALGNGEFGDAVPTASNAGTYTVRYYVKGDMNHNDSDVVEVSVTIGKADAVVDVAPAALEGLVYTGGAQELVSEGSTNDGELQYALGDGEFAADVPTATDAGTYTVRYYVMGDANHNDSAEAEVSVAIAKAQVPVPVGRSLAYTGEPQSGVELGSGYVLSGTSSASEVGTYEVVATLEDPANYAWADGQDGYSRTITWSITAETAKLNVAPTAKDGLVYTGSPQALVNEGSATNGTLQYALGNGAFGADVPTATNAGTYTVRYYVKGDAGYSDTAVGEVSVTIAKATAAVSSAPAAIEGLAYTGEAQALVSEGSATSGVLQYALGDGEFGDTVPTATDAGAYTVRYYVKGDENHNDSAVTEVSATIAKADAAVDVAPAVLEGLVYTGSAQALVSEGSATGGTLQYALGNGEFGDAVPTATHAGTYTVRYYVKGDANHSDSAEVEVSASIAQADISTATIAKIADTTYTGSAVTPAPKVTWNGADLVSGTDYTLTYSNNVNVSNKATVTVTGTGDFTGTASATFRIGFKDVKKGTWYYNVVYRANDLGLIGGYSGPKEGTFGPNDNIQRGQVAIILWNLARKPAAGSGAKDFSDVNKGAYYYSAVRWASSVGVVSGGSDGTFRPTDNVTREELASMLRSYYVKVAGKTAVGSAADFASMPDAGSVSSWARNAVGFCFRNKILSGKNGMIAPKATATRAETAKMVVNLYDMLNA